MQNLEKDQELYENMKGKLEEKLLSLNAAIFLEQFDPHIVDYIIIDRVESDWSGNFLNNEEETCKNNKQDIETIICNHPDSRYTITFSKTKNYSLLPQCSAVTSKSGPNDFLLNMTPKVNFTLKPNIWIKGGHSLSYETKESMQKNLSPFAKNVLTKWYEKNIDYVYPSKAQKVILMEKCGITRRQLDLWFNNRRSRDNKSHGKKKH